MERMWRKVNHSFSGRILKPTPTMQSTDTVSSAGGFGDGQIVVAVAGTVAPTGSCATNSMPSSTATGRRLAASGNQVGSGAVAVSAAPSSSSAHQKSLSQHVLQTRTASSERRRRRRRKSRSRRSGVSCVGGGGGDNISSSGGFYTINESLNNAVASSYRHRQSQSSSIQILASSAPSGTVMMYPNRAIEVPTATLGAQLPAPTAIAVVPDISLRQRAVAKLRMFNFNLNWDLHMTHCKPCGPRLGGGGSSGGGNIITRRLCRNRRREDNELYRSNSFKFERFERKEYLDELSDTLKKQIAICDDYSLPVDFVKKRPSSFDPCLADALPSHPDKTRVQPSPQTEINDFAETQRDQQPPPLPQQQQQQQLQTQLGNPQPAVSLTTPSLAAVQNNQSIATIFTNSLSSQWQQHQQLPPEPQRKHIHIHPKTSQQRNQLQEEQLRQSHSPLPNNIKQASIKLIEGYSDPKDSKRHKKVYHKKGKRRQRKGQQQGKSLTQDPLPPSVKNKFSSTDNRRNLSSDSSAPKSSDEEEDKQSAKVPELNSPDSISDDLARPLPPQPIYRSPRKLTAVLSETNKRNPSPYYYSDLLKPKDKDKDKEKEDRSDCRQSTASEPPQLTQPVANLGAYRKSTSLDVPEQLEQRPAEPEDVGEETQLTSRTIVEVSEAPNRYSFTEEGVHIIRCDSPSTSTSEESDCSQCLKRREWHAKALALVRKTCNIQPLDPNATTCNREFALNLSCVPLEAGSPSSMPPHRLLGPAASCACVAPTINDDLEEYFRPRSIFYVHPHGVHECIDCSPDTKDLSATVSQVASETNSTHLAQLDPEDAMSGRTRQIYETAFDCKIAKSDDDLDEVDRVTNHSVLLQLNNGTGIGSDGCTPGKPDQGAPASKSSHSKSRLEGKRLKNTKNQAIQEQASNSGNSAGSPLTIGVGASGSGVYCPDSMASSVSSVSAALSHVRIHEQDQDLQNHGPSSTTKLPMRGYTPSPPSTAPLPMKFPSKHDRFFMNSIKSAPNIPSTHPAHPRLRDLSLPIKSSLRQQQHQQQLHQQQGSSIGTSNENSLIDSAYVNPPSSTSAFLHHHHPLTGSSRTRSRPRSFVLESGRVLELRKSHASHHHQHVGNGGRRHHNYSSTESIATSSSGGSMESLRSSTSEGNRSTSSSESRHSISLSSHSSESGSSSVAFPLRAPVVIHSKLHILSPISDKSSQEPASELSEHNKTQNASPDDASTQKQQQQPQHSQPLEQHPLHGQTQALTMIAENARPSPQLQIDALKKRTRPPSNKTLQQLTDEILGSDSGISLHSREDGKPPVSTQKFVLPKLNFSPADKVNNCGLSAASAAISSSGGVPQDLRDLPFDMPKLRRRKTLQQEACTSGSATSVDLGDLPFDMPKLRRRLRGNQAEINNLMVDSTESSGVSQASSSHSMRDDTKTSIRLDTAMFRQNLTLNLNEPRQAKKFGSLDLRGLPTNKELNLNFPQGFTSAVDLIDVSIPLERQGWYHGAISRIEAEATLRPLSEGSFLVRNCESTKQDYSLSLKGAKGFMHMRIQRNDAGQYILGQFSRPFETVPDMIRHFCLNRLPVRGAEHMCLIEPVIVQLL